MFNLRMFKKIKNTLYLYISQIVEKFLYLILLIFISRYLGAEGLGQYASSFAIVSMFFIFVNGGFDSLLIREISLNKANVRNYLLSLVALKLVLGILIFFVIGYLLNILPAFSDIKNFILILAFSNLAGSISQVYYCILIAYEKMKQVMVVSIITNIIIVSSALVSLIWKRDLLLLFGCFFIGSVSSLFLSMFLVSRLGIRPALQIDFKVVLGLIKKNMPFLLSSVFAFMLFRIDVVMLKLFRGNDVVGLYRAAYSFLINFEAFPSFFMMSLYPKFSRLIKKDKPLLARLYKRSFLNLLLINIIILMPIFILGDRLIAFVFGDTFKDSVIILRWAAIAIFFLFQNACNFYFLNALNKPGINAFIFFLGFFMNFILDLFLIPRYSYYGVLMSVVIVYSFIFILSSYIAVRKARALYE